MVSMKARRMNSLSVQSAEGGRFSSFSFSRMRWSMKLRGFSVAKISGWTGFS